MPVQLLMESLAHNFITFYIIYAGKNGPGGLFMKDYLKELCASLKIGIIFTDDDYTALSAGVKEGKVFLKADKVFIGCPEKVQRQS